MRRLAMLYVLTGMLLVGCGGGSGAGDAAVQPDTAGSTGSTGGTGGTGTAGSTGSTGSTGNTGSTGSTGSTGDGSSTPAVVTLTGSLTGLAAGASLNLQDASGQATALRANGSFSLVTLASATTDGSFSLSIQRQPAGQACEFQSASGPAGTVTRQTAPLVISCVTVPLEVLYAGDWNASHIVQWRIGSDGGLTPLATPVVANPAGPERLAVEPLHRFLYVVTSGKNLITQYAIGPEDGALAALSPATIATGLSPGAIAFDPAGRFAYVPNGAQQSLSQFALDGGTGQLSRRIEVATGYVPCDVAVDPTGSALWVSNSWVLGAALSSVQGYAVDTVTGDLSPGKFTGTYGGPCHMALSRAGVMYIGHFSWGPDYLASSRFLEQYQVHGTALDYLDSPVRTTADALALLLDSAEAHLDVLDTMGITRYAIAPGGSIAQQAPVRVDLPAGCNAADMSRDSAGRLYVACASLGTLAVYEDQAGSLRLARSIALPDPGNGNPPQPYSVLAVKVR